MKILRTANENASGHSAGQLTGRLSVVTGGAGDLGLATAAQLAAVGSHVILADKMDCADHANALSARGLQTSSMLMDVSDESSVNAGFDDILRTHGRVDILVNNAGIGARTPSDELSIEDWNRVLAVNLTGTFLCSRTAARYMRAQKQGAIVNIASIMGMVGNALYANPAYHASKGGIINLTRAQAAEWAHVNIRVNAVAPTFVETRLTEGLLSEAGMKESIIARTPMARIAQPEEIAATVLFLASDSASMITGIVVPVDGGWTAT
ncbi:MAG: SDR family oxidoreductase [Nitratireductor sp.]|nr:SDR family oxidoreductase [Nitratireductor sp.]